MLKNEDKALPHFLKMKIAFGKILKTEELKSPVEDGNKMNTALCILSGWGRVPRRVTFRANPVYILTVCLLAIWSFLIWCYTRTTTNLFLHKNLLQKKNSAPDLLFLKAVPFFLLQTQFRHKKVAVYGNGTHIVVEEAIPCTNRDYDQPTPTKLFRIKTCFS